MENSTKKQFATIQEYNLWTVENFSPKTFEAMLNYKSKSPEEEEIRKALENQGYDTENLIADGHAYAIGKDMYDGWYYEDEVDRAYLERTGRKVELRKRESNL